MKVSQSLFLFLETKSWDYKISGLKLWRLTMLVGLIIFSSCQQHSGLYSPSFEAIQTVYDKGQSLHSISVGPSIGKSFNYSPIKNLALLVDGRYNVFMPQVSAAIGGYSANYVSRSAMSKSNIRENYQVGFHFDSYLGFGYHSGHEFLGYEGISNPFFSEPNEELTFRTARAYWQTGVHMKARHFKLDMAYKLNYLDIEKLVFSPRSENFTAYVNYLAQNNPFLIHEIQMLMGLGSQNLRAIIGLSIALPGEHDDVIDYSKFTMVHAGFTYIFDKFE